jgi:hypothetical protein
VILSKASRAWVQNFLILLRRMLSPISTLLV